MQMGRYPWAFTSINLFLTARLLPSNADDFVHVTAHALRILRSAVYATIILLGMMVATDLLIVAASVLPQDAFVVALIGTAMFLRGSKSNLARPEPPTKSGHTMLAALDALMTEKHIYKDRNLTRARVSRRLSVPIRDVSTAINRMTGENFSRYINGFRIRYAQNCFATRGGQSGTHHKHQRVLSGRLQFGWQCLQTSSLDDLYLGHLLLCMA